MTPTIEGILVDPILVTTPSNADAESASSWLQSLLGWLLEIQVGDFFWFHFFSCSQTLVRLGRFPDLRTLRRLCAEHSLDYNVGDIVRKVNAFFQDPARDALRSAETIDLLCTDGSLSIDPGAIRQRNVLIADTFEFELARLACDVTASPDDYGLHLVTLVIPDVEPQMTVRCVIALADPEELIERLSQARIDASFGLLWTPGDLHPLARFRSSIRTNQLHFEATVRRLAYSMGARSFRFSLGPHFWLSLTRSAIVTDSSAFDKLVRVCSFVLAGTAESLNVQLRPIREDETADSKQRTRVRDGAKAWRLTLVDKGVGWRLHFWSASAEAAAREFEFATVVTKGDPVVIPD